MEENISAITYISQKLEKLPLKDYILPKATVKRNKVTDIFYFNSTKLSLSTEELNFVCNIYQDEKGSNFSNVKDGSIEHILLDGETLKNDNENANDLKPTDNAMKLTESQLADDKFEITCCNSENISNKSTKCDDKNKSVEQTRCAPTTSDKSSSNPYISPTYSDSLPSNSKRSPNKRKRSLDYDNSPFSRSCDTEVCNIWKTEFRNIQRTLSFDEELLRSEDELLTFNSARSPSVKRYRNRPSVNITRMTCKSQPSTLKEYSFPKARKIKVIQLKRETNEKLIKTKSIVEPVKSFQSRYSNILTNENNTEHIFQPIIFAPDKNLQSF